MIIPASELIAAAKSNCDCLDQIQAKLFFDRNNDVVIIDVREPKEVEESKLKDSINIPRGLLEMRITDICEKHDTPILVHCKTGGRASLSASTLQIMGYSNVHAIVANYDDVKMTFG
tara:strand:- start:143 stop:493 length:351 start_codon:yes stop_codon:yes gene_type:complete